MKDQKAIFISYRRQDSTAETHRIYDRLLNYFDESCVFQDVDSIPLGVNFRDFLAQEIVRCHVVLVVIGPSWLTVTDEDGNRKLDSPTDWVRIEIEHALQRKIPVIPLLVRGAQMPEATDLPDSLKALSDFQSIPIRENKDFSRDMERLVDGINMLFSNSTQASSDENTDALASQPASGRSNAREGRSRPSMSNSISSSGSIPRNKKSTYRPQTRSFDSWGNTTTFEKNKIQYYTEKLNKRVTLDMVVVSGGEFRPTPLSDSIGGIVLQFTKNILKGKSSITDSSINELIKVDSFCIGKYPITQAQWKAVAALRKVRRKLQSRAIYIFRRSASCRVSDLAPSDGILCSTLTGVRKRISLAKLNRVGICMPSEYKYPFFFWRND